MSHRHIVLVGIDRAADMEPTMDVALSTAKALGAEVHALHVVSHRHVRPDRGASLSKTVFHNERGVDRAAPLAARARPPSSDSVPVRSVTLQGEPADVVPAYAQLHEATILVVGRDFGSSQLWRHGRVVDEVTRRSPVPVLVLPRRPTRDDGARGLRRIVAPVDFSIASAVALRITAGLSRRHGARVTVLHALQDVPQHMLFSGAEAWKVVRRLPAHTEAIAERLRRNAADVGAIEVDAEVATGDADDAILELAARSDADLVVMGVAQRAWLDRLLFGSTLRRVLRRATVPVLVVPVVAGAHAWPNHAAVEPITRHGWTASAAARIAA